MIALGERRQTVLDRCDTTELQGWAVWIGEPWETMRAGLRVDRGGFLMWSGLLSTICVTSMLLSGLG